MRILLTRPEEQAHQTAEKLTALGHTSVIAPLMEIEYRTLPTFNSSVFQAIAVTSGRAVDALARQAAFADLVPLPLYCVGDKTAAHARRSGFVSVHSAGGDADALTRMLIAALPKDKGRILYAAGRDRTGDLKGALEQAGYSVELQVLYEARQLDAFPKSIGRKIKHGHIDAALVYSQRGATVLREAVCREELERFVQPIEFFAISEAAAQPIIDWGIPRISWADQPNEAALLDLLGKPC